MRFTDGLGTIKEPGKIIKEYNNTVTKFKVDIYGESAEDASINYHKIAAFYIYAFLKHKLFYLDIPKETKQFKCSDIVILANEFFIVVFLDAIFKAWNDNDSMRLMLPKKYADNFIKHIHRYKNNIKLLDPISLSNTISLIEQLYFCDDK